MGIFFERALTALERIADALTSLAQTAQTPLGDLVDAQRAERLNMVPRVAGESGPETAQGSPEAPAGGRTRVSKVRREAVRDAVVNAGLDLAKIEKDFNAVWPSWSGAQCDKAEAMAAGANSAAASDPENDDFDSPAPVATPPAPAGTAFAENPPSHYDKDREALTSAIAKVKAALGDESGDAIVRGLMASIGGAPDMLSMDPIKYAAVCAAILAVVPAAPPAPAPQAEAKPVTLESVRALAQQLTAKLGDKQPVRDIIQRVAGTAKLTDVPKDKLAELFAAFKEAA